MRARRKPASCHPDRPVSARKLCKRCYGTAWARGGVEALADHPTSVRAQVDFVRDYETLRADGLLRIQIAARLGMTRMAVDTAYIRAVRAGMLRPDPPDMVVRARDRALELSGRKRA